jgi:hypothetical protein
MQAYLIHRTLLLRDVAFLIFVNQSNKRVTRVLRISMFVIQSVKGRSFVTEGENMPRVSSHPNPAAKKKIAASDRRSSASHSISIDTIVAPLSPWT